MSDSNLFRHTMRRPSLMLLTGHSAPVVAAAFSPDGQLLATGSYDCTIVLWDTASGAMLRRLSGHRESVGPLAFSADGETLASAGYGTVRLWNVMTGRPKRVIDGYSGPLLFSSDSALLLAFAEEEAVWLDTRTGRPVRTVPVSLDGSYAPPRAVVSLDGATMATAIQRDATTLEIWDLKAGKLKRRRGFPPRIPQKVRDRATGRLKTVYSNHTDSPESLALSPDGRFLAVAGTSSLWLCSILTGRRTRLLVVGDRGPGSLAFSADGRALASGFADGSVKLWSVPSGKLLWSASGHSSWVSTLAFSPDGQMLASGSHDKTVRLWRTTTGECLLGLHPVDGPGRARARHALARDRPARDAVLGCGGEPARAVQEDTGAGAETVGLGCLSDLPAWHTVGRGTAAQASLLGAAARWDNERTTVGGSKLRDRSQKDTGSKVNGSGERLMVDLAAL